MRFINGGVGPRSPVAPVLVVSAFASGAGAIFTRNMGDDGVFRVIDALDERLLDEGTGQDGAASLLRRIHENIEMIVFTVLCFGWTGGVAVYNWRGVFRNWGYGPSMAMEGALHIRIEGAGVRLVELRLNGEAYLDLVHEGRAPRPYDAVPRQQRRIGL